ncbi:hypothetical protein BJV74DRAFT_826647 [Russula compacta]|nr:hypothetical protein BJV74DRAFT_826647 [Russula compacta]
MELGFADTIKRILACMEGSRKLAIQAVKGECSMEVRGWDWSLHRLGGFPLASTWRLQFG